MEYLNQADGSILTQGQVRKLHSNKSLPRVFTADTCEYLGITPILATPKPEPSSRVKVVVRDGVTTDANGNTVQNWTEKPMFTEYRDENDRLVTQGEQETEYLANELQKLKDQKCKEIDTATADAITELVGDAIAQRNLMMEAQLLQRKEANGTITAEQVTRLNDLEAQALQVATLRAQGNAQEQSIQAMTTFEEVEAV